MTIIALAHMLCHTQRVLTFQSHQARVNMRAILSAAERGEPVQIKRYETVTAVVVSPEWFARAQEVLGELAEGER